MADSRRAHPHYQIGVDQMILEYLLYSTTKAFLTESLSQPLPSPYHGRRTKSHKNLGDQRGVGSEEDEEDEKRSPSREKGLRAAAASASLLAIFDAFVQIFKANHGRLPRQIQYGVRLLEFIVLFTQRSDLRLLTRDSRDQIKRIGAANWRRRVRWNERSVAQQQQQQLDASNVLEIRAGCESADLSTNTTPISPPGRAKDATALRSLLQRRQEEEQLAAGQTRDPKAITHSNSHPRPSHPRPPSTLARTIPLLYLLPQFLHLSAEKALSMGQDVSQQWMDLAAEFMLQTALEMYCRCDGHAHISGSYSPLVDTSNEGAEMESDELSPVDIAFAWGWLSPPAIPPVDVGGGGDARVPGHSEDEVFDNNNDMEATTAAADLEQQTDEMEDLINDMFELSSSSSPHSNSPQPFSQPRSTAWDETKARYISLFHSSPSSSSSSTLTPNHHHHHHPPPPSRETLTHITTTFPTRSFERKVLDYLDSLWMMEATPLLVKVEGCGDGRGRGRNGDGVGVAAAGLAGGGGGDRLAEMGIVMSEAEWRELRERVVRFREGSATTAMT